MEGVNPFIKNNKQEMIMFLDKLGVRPFPSLHSSHSGFTARNI